MTVGELRELVSRHSASVHVLSALALAMDARLDDEARDGEIAARSWSLVEALGAAEVVASADREELAPVLASIRGDILFGGQLLSEPPGAGGWRKRSDGVHQAYGDVSAGLARLVQQRIAPQLGDLSARLATPGAAFLDIGTGVGSLAIAMARRWPGLQAVGIEPLPDVVAMARRNVEAAGLGSRIEIRCGRGESLEEAAAFDLAFVASAFIPARSLGAIVERGAVALRPGGWLMVAVLSNDLEGLAAAIVEFRIATFGGTSLAGQAAERLLEGCGLVEIRRIEPAAGAPFGFVAGQRPE